METEDQHHNQEVQQDTMDQLIRASSLGPEREQLKFVVPTLVGAPNEVSELVQHIQHVAEQFLYHWKTFPIGRPPQRAPSARQWIHRIGNTSQLIKLRRRFSSSRADSSGRPLLISCVSRSEQKIEGN